MSKKRLVLRVLENILIQHDGDSFQVRGPNAEEPIKVWNDLSSGVARLVNHEGRHALLYLRPITENVQANQVEEVQASLSSASDDTPVPDNDQSTEVSTHNNNKSNVMF